MAAAMGQDSAVATVLATVVQRQPGQDYDVRWQFTTVAGATDALARCKIKLAGVLDSASQVK